VAKSLAFSPDGKQLAVGLADAPGFVLLQVGSWLPLPVASTVLIKRLGYFANGVLWRSTYSDGFDVLPPGAQAAQPLGGCPKSLCSQGETGANAAQTALVHVSVGGELTLIRQQEPERAESLLHVPWVAAVALSADSHTVAIAEEARVRLLDVGSRSFFRELTDPGQRILHIAFSADDRLLVAGELDRTVRVWRLSDGVEIAVLRGHSQRVVQVLFAPPALGLLSASWDGTIARWELDRLVAAPTVLPGLVAAKWALPIEAALRPPAR
jgi:WD40 repeat protein